MQTHPMPLAAARPRRLLAAGVLLLAAALAFSLSGLTVRTAVAASDIGELQTGLLACAGGAWTGALEAPIDADAQTLDVAANCEATLDLGGFDLAVQNIVLGAGAHLTVSGAGTLTADATATSRLAGIRTTGATLVIDGATVVAVGGGGGAVGGSGAGIGGDGAAAGTMPAHGADGPHGLAAIPGGDGGDAGQGGNGISGSVGGAGGAGGTVTITAGSNVTATGGVAVLGGQGAGIGGGGGGAGGRGSDGGAGGNGAAGGDGTPPVNDGAGGNGGEGGRGGSAGWGGNGGEGGVSGSIHIEEGATVTAAGIGGGQGGNGGDGGHGGNAGDGGDGGDGADRFPLAGGDGGNGGDGHDGGNGLYGGNGGDGGAAGTILIAPSATVDAGVAGVGGGPGGGGGEPGNRGERGLAGAGGNGGLGDPNGSPGDPGTDGSPGFPGFAGGSGARGADPTGVTVDETGIVPTLQDAVDYVQANNGTGNLRLPEETLTGASARAVIPAGVDIEIRGLCPTDGSWPQAVLDAAGTGRVLDIAVGATVDLECLQVTGGSANEGAGIRNAGTLTILSSRIVDNHVTGLSARGGGIHNTGSGALTVASSTIEENSVSHIASTFLEGGGLSNYGTLVVHSSEILANEVSNTASDPNDFAHVRGGGISNRGTATVVDSVVSLNEVVAEADIDVLAMGGGIANPSPGRMVVFGGSIVQNVARADAQDGAAIGGGVYHEGQPLTLRGTRFQDNVAVGLTNAEARAHHAFFGAAGDARWNEWVGPAADGPGAIESWGTERAQAIATACPATGCVAELTVTFDGDGEAALTDGGDAVYTAVMDVRGETFGDLLARYGGPNPSPTVTADTTWVLPLGLTVALEATAEAGGAFTGWTPGTCGGTIRVDGDVTCQATFDAAPVAATPEPSPVTIEVDGLVLTVINQFLRTLLPDSETSLQTQTLDGNSASILLPPGVLPVDLYPTTALLAAIADLQGLRDLPGGAEPLAGFIMQLLDGQGDPLAPLLAPLVQMTVNLTPASVGDSPLDELVLVRWTPDGWFEVPHELVVQQGGAVTFTAEFQQPGVYVVLHAPLWGALSIPPAPLGLTLTLWGGGGIERLEDALGGHVAWVVVDGQWLGYGPGRPSFVNAPFLAHFPSGLPAGIPMLVSN